MHIDVVKNRGSRPTVLLRETRREGKTVRKRTLANLSSLPANQIAMIRRVLNGEELGSADGEIEIIRSQHHGHADAVATAMGASGLPS